MKKILCYYEYYCFDKIQGLKPICIKATEVLMVLCGYRRLETFSYLQLWDVDSGARGQIIFCCDLFEFL